MVTARRTIDPFAEFLRPPRFEHEDEKRIGIVADPPDFLSAVMDGLCHAFVGAPDRFVFQRIGAELDRLIPIGLERRIVLPPFVKRVPGDPYAFGGGADARRHRQRLEEFRPHRGGADGCGLRPRVGK